MKDIKLLFTALLLALFTFASCDEKEETGDFDNWKERNAQYLDSIAGVARANTDGLWKVVLAEGLDSSREWPVGCYVYCKVLTEGSGKHPAATDRVKCHYEGRLIDGTVFDSSYRRGEPATFPLNGVIAGWTEGLQLMGEGAKFRFFIPYNLAYGARGAGESIPPYAALVFDVELIEVQ